MTGALALLFLLTVTLVIVRVASVALLLTGLPQPVVRFQATSALTGTGFTTSEAEGTMHHPVRRRILTMLMFAGHLGLLSLSSTVIVAMTSAQGSYGAFIQAVAMLSAVGVICALATSKTLDILMYNWVGRLLNRLGRVTPLPYEILYESPNGYQLGEHVVESQSEVGDCVQLVTYNGETIMSQRPGKRSTGDRIVLHARKADHLTWAMACSDSNQDPVS